MGEKLTGEQFAELAALWPAQVEEQSLTLVRESELPSDWLETTVECYSAEAGYYSLALYGEMEPMKAEVDAYAARRMAEAGCASVLDVGVGDGYRLDRICALVEGHGAPRPQMYGIELSDRMIELAEGRGVNVVKHDMREGIPEFGMQLDCILFLSGDFGYLMDPVAGDELRLRVLDSAYDRLSVGGDVILEFVSRDPRPTDDGADVFFFSRIPWVHDPDRPTGPRIEGPETWQYVKTFTIDEVVRLIEASRFELDRSSIRYIVRDSPDEGRIGEFVEDSHIRADEVYRILASVTR